MQELDGAAVLYFRIFREVSLPLFEALITRLCASAALPHEFATVLDDIGQRFIRLGSAVDQELLRRGALADEVEADETVEAGIDAAIVRLLAHLPEARTPETERADALLKSATGQQALKAAFALARPLPIAPPKRRSAKAKQGIEAALKS